jgi:hypothetical protein
MLLESTRKYNRLAVGVSFVADKQSRKFINPHRGRPRRARVLPAPGVHLGSSWGPRIGALPAMQSVHGGR